MTTRQHTSQCRVCGHPERATIDAELVGGRAQRSIADAYGLSKDSVRRHVDAHLSAALKLATAKRAAAGPTTALARLEDLYDRATRLLEDAESKGATGQALAAIKELRNTVEVIAKITGELDERPTVTVNLVESAEWRQLVTVVLAALTGHPAARVDVARALSSADLIGVIEP